jgi:hypothetical protein
MKTAKLELEDPRGKAARIKAQLASCRRAGQIAVFMSIGKPGPARPGENERRGKVLVVPANKDIALMDGCLRAQSSDGSRVFTGDNVGHAVVQTWPNSLFTYEYNGTKSATELVESMRTLPCCAGYTFNIVPDVPEFMVLSPSALADLLRAEARSLNVEVQDLHQHAELDWIFGVGQDFASLAKLAVNDVMDERAKVASVLMN